MSAGDLPQVLQQTHIRTACVLCSHGEHQSLCGLSSHIEALSSCKSTLSHVYSGFCEGEQYAYSDTLITLLLGRRAYSSLTWLPPSFIPICHWPGSSTSLPRTQLFLGWSVGYLSALLSVADSLSWGLRLSEVPKSCWFMTGLIWKHWSSRKRR